VGIPLKAGEKMLREEFDRIDDLEQAAIQEITDKGYEKASINRIIKEAGISKGTFYYHFRSKEELFFFIVEKAMNKKIEFMNNNADPEIQKKMMHADIFEILEMQLELAIRFAHEHPQYVRFFNKVINDSDSTMFKKLNGKYRFEDVDAYKQMVQARFAAGDFSDAFSYEFVEKMISHIFSNYYSIFEELADLGDMSVIKENMKMLIAFLKRGLGSKRNE
jgi:AcrR family transcriptional regulator